MEEHQAEGFSNNHEGDCFPSGLGSGGLPCTGAIPNAPYASRSYQLDQAGATAIVHAAGETHNRNPVLGSRPDFGFALHVYNLDKFGLEWGIGRDNKSSGKRPHRDTDWHIGVWVSPSISRTHTGSKNTMSDPVILAIIAAIPPTVASLLALRSSRKNRLAITEVHLAVNSRLDQLLKATATASHAEGMKEQKEKQ